MAEKRMPKPGSCRRSVTIHNEGKNDREACRTIPINMAPARRASRSERLANAGVSVFIVSVCLVSFKIESRHVVPTSETPPIGLANQIVISRKTPRVDEHVATKSDRDSPISCQRPIRRNNVADSRMDHKKSTIERPVLAIDRRPVHELSPGDGTDHRLFVVGICNSACGGFASEIWAVIPRNDETHQHGLFRIAARGSDARFSHSSRMGQVFEVPSESHGKR